MKITKKIYIHLLDSEWVMLETYLKKFGNTYDMFRILIMCEFELNTQNTDTINLACGELISMSLEPVTTILKSIQNGIQ